VQLRDYIRIFIRRAWVIALVVVIASGSALVVSKIQTPEYRSTIILNVWPARLDWGLQQSIQNLMRNWALKIVSRDTALRTINQLELDITPEAFLSKVTAKPVESDSIIEVTADDYDPLIARDIAQTTAELFVQDIDAWKVTLDRRDQVDITIRDYALPGVLHKPKWKINVLAGAVLGGVIGVLLVLVLQWLEADILRTPDDVEQHTGLAVLGIIPLTAPTRARKTPRAPTSASAQR
jgi:capsular polysaccharide biosynthesis protein